MKNTFAFPTDLALSRQAGSGLGSSSSLLSGVGDRCRFLFGDGEGAGDRERRLRVGDRGRRITRGWGGWLMRFITGALGGSGKTFEESGEGGGRESR